eukprot:scaffold2011_cov233-Pinguiococcus_pyrenoidosus.AAC.10
MTTCCRSRGWASRTLRGSPLWACLPRRCLLRRPPEPKAKPELPLEDAPAVVALPPAVFDPMENAGGAAIWLASGSAFGFADPKDLPKAD